MKIIELKAENILNLKAIEIKPENDMIILTGKNGAGKSAVLDSIWMALGGDKPAKPVRHGEEQGSITLDLGAYTVTRKFTQGGKNDYIKVEGKKGEVFRAPHTLLKSLYNQISFDPLEFANMKPVEQRNLLMRIAKLDLSQIDNKIEQTYQERTFAHREMDKIKSHFDSIWHPTKNEIEAIEKAPDVSELTKEMEEILKQQSIYDKYIRDRKKLKDEISDIEQRIRELQKLLKLRKSELGKIKIPEKPDVERLNEIRVAIHNSREIQKKVEGIKRYKEVKNQLGKATKNWEKLDNQIKQLRDKKIEKIKNTKFPVNGLAITDNGVSFNDIPFEQLSTGQKIRISTAIAISLNPELKVLQIRDGSLLDSENLKMIAEIAKGYQLWIEKTDETGEVGIYIEAGEIKNKRKEA